MSPQRIHSFSSSRIAHLLVVLTLFVASGAQAQSARRCEALFGGWPKSVQKVMFLEDGSDSILDADREARRLLAASAKERNTVIEYFLATYRKIPKKNLNPMKQRRFAGRRLIERVLSLVARRDLQFKERIDAGDTPKQAFQRAFESQTKFIGTRYSAEDIDVVLEILRADLPAQQARIGRYALKYVVGGSFVNGKASLLESDVDISINNPEMKDVAKSWEHKIAQGLSDRHGFTNLAVELHGEPPSFYGKLNTFVFEVAADGIKLLVYPPASSSDHGTLTSQEPDVFDWR